MAIAIDTFGRLQEYLQGVLTRAGHHAGNVDGVVLTLLGAVLWRNDGDIEVREYNGSPANIIWFWVNGNRYALTYNHATEEIELRERTQSGTVIKSFDNSTSYPDIISVFRNL